MDSCTHVYRSSQVHNPYVLSTALAINVKLCMLAGEVGGAYYGIKHPMKPHRMRMTNELIIEYGLVDHLDVYVSCQLQLKLASSLHAMLQHSA